MSDSAPSAWGTMRRLTKYVKDYKIGLIGAVIGMLAYAGADALLLYTIKPMIDVGLQDRNSTVLKVAPFFVMGAVLARGFFNFVSAYGMAWVGSHVVMKMRQEVFEKMLTLPVSYYDQRSKGELISNITYVSSKVSNAVTNALVTTIREGAMVLFLLGMMFYQSWILSLSFFVLLPIIAVMIRKISGRFRMLSRRIQKAMGGVTTATEQMISGHRVVITFGGQDIEKKRFAAANNMSRRQQMKMVVVSSLSSPVIQVVASTSLVVVLWMASNETLFEQLTPGTFTLMITSIIIMLKPLKALTGVNNQLQQGVAAGQTLFEILDHPGEPDEGTIELERAKGHLEYRDVVFTYPEKESPVLDHINFTLEPGQTLALVGRSGGGKSTVASLLPRFYNVDSGEILLDGVNIQDYTLKSLRSQYALVSQQVVLFNDTIANNISYGQPSTSRAEIERAAEAARVMEFVRDMPEGLDTVIGENGVMLSGGQRQRVAIARAILRDVPLLILDEATSALDTESERYIQAALDELQQGRTSLVIAHRLSTIESADKILVLDKGQIVEAGTHSELLSKGGAYAQLHKLQFSGHE